MTEPAQEAALFDAEVTTGAYGTVITNYSMPADDDRLDERGPGQPPRPRGVEDAKASTWWVEQAEAVVMRIVASGGTVTSDDLHDVFPDTPSATGAAIGALFRRLAKEGRLTLLRHQPSRRPSRNGSYIAVWSSPS